MTYNRKDLSRKDLAVTRLIIAILAATPPPKSVYPFAELLSQEQI